MDKPTEKDIEEVLAGRSSAEIARKVAVWFATDEGREWLSHRMDKDIGNATGTVVGRRRFQEGKHVGGFRLRLPVKRGCHVLGGVRWFAAVFFPVVLLVWTVWVFSSRFSERCMEKEKWVEIRVPEGKIQRKVLPDGTEVTLNSASSLRYSGTFDGQPREVYLSGEGYFKVAKDKARPFAVRLASSACVKVLGTSFNVKAYAEDDDIAVCLDEGKVDFEVSGRPVYAMCPGMELVYHKKVRRCMVGFYESDCPHTLWMRQILRFRNTPLYDVAKVLSRRFGVDFRFDGEEIGQGMLFTWTYGGQDLQEALNELEAISSLHFIYNPLHKEVRVSE